MAKQKTRRKIATLGAGSKVRAAFIRSLYDDASIDWDRKRLGTRCLALDVIYLLAVSVDPIKYGGYTGLRAFCKEADIDVDLVKKKIEEPR